MKQDAKYIRWFEAIKIEDIPIVGGKNASWERCIMNL
jgi:phosphoenolpyruvate synthase/pyruvate phosphate dikinase